MIHLAMRVTITCSRSTYILTEPVKLLDIEGQLVHRLHSLRAHAGRSPEMQKQKLSCNGNSLPCSLGKWYEEFSIFLKISSSIMITMFYYCTLYSERDGIFIEQFKGFSFKLYRTCKISIFCT